MDRQHEKVPKEPRQGRQQRGECRSGDVMRKKNKEFGKQVSVDGR